MSARHVAVCVIAIACIAITSAFLRHRAMSGDAGPGVNAKPASSRQPNATAASAPASSVSATSVPAIAAAPPLDAVAPALAAGTRSSTIATTASPALPGPSPASAGGAAAAALERFGRDATQDVNRCAGPSNAPLAPIPVRLVFHRVSGEAADQQSFVAVRAIPLPTLSAGGAPVRAAPEAERCLGRSLIGHAVFLPRDANHPAAEFQHLVTLQLAAVPAK